MLRVVRSIQKILFSFGHLCLLDSNLDFKLTENQLSYKNITIELNDEIDKESINNLIDSLIKDRRLLLYVFLPNMNQ